MKTALKHIALTAALSFSAAEAGTFTDQFFDKEDGWLDGSDWVLENAVGFLPVPIIITEPAVGQGLGLAAAFFHPPKDYDADEFVEKRKQALESGEREKFVLPNVTAVAAAATNNGTWLVGGGHLARWRDDTIRFEPVAGYASINIKYYLPSINPDSKLTPEDGLEFNAEGALVSAPLAFRIKQSNFFIGGLYDYATIETKFDNQFPILEPLNFDTRQSTLGVFAFYDSRNTPFTPTNGTYAKITYKRDSEKIGSDWDFDRTIAFVNQYVSLGSKWVWGIRANAEYIDGEAPFYAVPYIDMRGIPALRYQGDAMALAETELRWQFHPRIAAVGFIGAGKAADSYSDFSDSPSRVTKGGGIRYVLARKLGMQGGIDVARGPEDTYWYLTIGTAWRD